MGVSKNRGTTKWMVKIMENPIKMDDLGVPLFSETSIFVRSFLQGLGGSKASKVKENETISCILMEAPNESLTFTVPFPIF